MQNLKYYLRRLAAHYRAAGFLDPRDEFDAAWYLAQYPDVARAGMNPLAHYLQFGKAEGRLPAAPLKGSVFDEIFRRRFPALQSLDLFYAPGSMRRVTLVTDSINQGSLFGGVGTAIIFAALLAKKLGAALRVATRTERADGVNFEKILKLNEIEWKDNIEFTYVSARDPSTQLSLYDNDIFLTTSWWTTYCVKESVNSKRIIYLLQEDERMFYPLGDDYLLCTETISDAEIRFVINSKLLYDYLIGEGFGNISQNGLFFEPAFPHSQYYMDEKRDRTDRNFFFYARPNNPRNLYYRGLEAINAALEQGVLQPDVWNFFFVGRDLHDFSLAAGARATIFQNLEWADYAALMRQIDVGLSLMYTPHPSYPPLDLVASGAVAVTNRFGPKQSLEVYSKNIICTGLSTDDLVKGIADAIKIADNWQRRKQNYLDNRLIRDWGASFNHVLDTITGG